MRIFPSPWIYSIVRFGAGQIVFAGHVSRNWSAPKRVLEFTDSVERADFPIFAYRFLKKQSECREQDNCLKTCLRWARERLPVENKVGELEERLRAHNMIYCTEKRANTKGNGIVWRGCEGGPIFMVSKSRIKPFRVALILV